MNDLRTAAQQAKIDEIAVEQWKLRMVFYDENGEPSMSRRPEPDEIRAALAQQAEPVSADAAYQRWLADTHAPALRRMDSQGAFSAGWQAALAQQAEPVEPVAWMFELARNFNLEGYGGWEKRITEYRPNTPEGSVRNVTPLKPLTEEEIERICMTYQSPRQAARAIERAHGIGGQND